MSLLSANWLKVKNIFVEYHKIVKQFGSRSGTTFSRAWYGSKLFAKVISMLVNYRFTWDSLKVNIVLTIFSDSGLISSPWKLISCSSTCPACKLIYIYCSWINPIEQTGRRNVFVSYLLKICLSNRGYLLFWSEYQIYFIECVENIRIFMSAQHEWKFRCFQLTRWNKVGIY